MSRIKTFFNRHPKLEPVVTENLSRQLVGDTFVTKVSNGKAVSGLVYSDFSANSLIDSGSIDLLIGSPLVPSSNSLNDTDNLSPLSNLSESQIDNFINSQTLNSEE